MVDQQRVVRPARRAGHAVQVEGPDSERGAVRTAGEPLARGRVVDRDRGERVVVAERVVTRNDRVARQEWKVREAVHTGVGGVRDVRVRDLVARGTHVEGAVGEHVGERHGLLRPRLVAARRGEGGTSEAYREDEYRQPEAAVAGHKASPFVREAAAHPAAAVRRSILYPRWARAFESAARATAARGKRPLRQPGSRSRTWLSRSRRWNGPTS